MIMIILYSILYIIFTIYDYKIWSKGKIALSLIYVSITIFSFVIVVLIALGKEIPSPTYLIENIVSSVVKIDY